MNLPDSWPLVKQIPLSHHRVRTIKVRRVLLIFRMAEQAQPMCAAPSKKIATIQLFSHYLRSKSSKHRQPQQVRTLQHLPLQCYHKGILKIKRKVKLVSVNNSVVILKWLTIGYHPFTTQVPCSSFNKWQQMSKSIIHTSSQRLAYLNRQLTIHHW